MYWKTLPREEREKWEAKAVIAQAEHRKRYPDWRFRPGANATAKLKVKDGTVKKRQTHGRKAKEEVEEREKNKERRCAKIADLLVKGKKGPALEAAVKEWEGHPMDATGGHDEAHLHPALHFDLGRGNQNERGFKVPRSYEHHIGPRRDGRIGVESTADSNQLSLSLDDKLLMDGMEDDNNKTRSRTPDAVSDARFRVPLTSMFRRSLSAPASQSRCPFPEILSAPSGLLTHVRRETVSIPVTDGSPLPQPHGLFVQQKRHEAATSRDNHQHLDCLTSNRLLSCPDPGSTRCNDVSVNATPSDPRC